MGVGVSEQRVRYEFDVEPGVAHPPLITLAAGPAELSDAAPK